MTGHGHSWRQATRRLQEEADMETAYAEIERTRPAPAPYVPRDPVSTEPDPPEDEDWFDREVERTFTSWPAPHADRDLAVRATFDRVRRGRGA